MYVTGSSATVDNVDSPNINLTWNLNDIFASNGLKALTASNFDVVNLTPVVTGLSASSGAAGNTITINGQNFSGAAGHLSVYFGTTAASSVTFVSDSQITAVVPNGAGTVDVTVQSGVNETDNFSDNPNANVNKPNFGYGTSATSSADKFTYSSQGQTISGANSTAGFASPTVASGSTDLLTIVVEDTTGKPVTGLANSAFALALSGGTSGGTFGAVSETATPGTYTSTFTATTAGTASTLATTVSGVTLNARPTVTVSSTTAAPTVSGVSPALGPASGGTKVTITGTNFTGATGVAFGGTAAASFTVVSATQITATAPAGTGGTTVDITVTTAGGTSATSSADRFQFIAAPTITTQPSNLTVTVGQPAAFTVTASGSGLSYHWQKKTTSGAWVNVSSRNTSSFTGATTATFTIKGVKTSDAGTYRVVVSNVGGSVTSNAVTLTVNAAPAATTSTSGTKKHEQP
jgi:hypothetical protein